MTPLWLDQSALLPYFQRLAEHYSVREPFGTCKEEFKRACREMEAERRTKKRREYEQRVADRVAARKL